VGRLAWPGRRVGHRHRTARGLDGVHDDALRPERFGSSSDVQLWSLTDLAVQFALDGDGGSP
jgi:hypothetical protein